MKIIVSNKTATSIIIDEIFLTIFLKVSFLSVLLNPEFHINISDRIRRMSQLKRRYFSKENYQSSLRDSHVMIWLMSISLLSRYYVKLLLYISLS